MIVIFAAALIIAAILVTMRKQAEEARTVSDKIMKEFKKADASLEKLKDSLDD